MMSSPVVDLTLRNLDAGVSYSAELWVSSASSTFLYLQRLFYQSPKVGAILLTMSSLCSKLWKSKDMQPKLAQNGKKHFTLQALYSPWVFLQRPQVWRCLSGSLQKCLRGHRVFCPSEVLLRAEGLLRVVSGTHFGLWNSATPEKCSYLLPQLTVAATLPAISWP